MKAQSTSSADSNSLKVQKYGIFGQSMPNLYTDKLSPVHTPPSKLLSPNHRVPSFPPTSPRSLRRIARVPESGSPPVLESRSSPVPEFRSPPLIKPRQNILTTSCYRAATDSGGGKRSGRVDRIHDNRRYYTAGSIEDMKVSVDME